MSRLLKKPASLRDLIAHGRHIARDNPNAAERFLDAAERTFNQLVNHPFLGRPRHF